MKTHIKHWLIIVLSLILISCGGSDPSASSDEIIPGTAETTYKVTFISSWTAISHPDNFPANAHFSGLIGATHNRNVVYWQEGTVASNGIELMAETGSKTELIAEIDPDISAGTADKIISLGGLPSSPNSLEFILQVSSNHHYLTIVSMLAPSPDWFVGVSALNLVENGIWIETMTVDLYAYDAGSDGGASYTSADADSDPKQAIYKITSAPFMVDLEVKPVGRLHLQKQ